MKRSDRIVIYRCELNMSIGDPMTGLIRAGAYVIYRGKEVLIPARGRVNVYVLPNGGVGWLDSKWTPARLLRQGYFSEIE